ncbi:MAG: hypothetical protein M1818_003430 [Claussenomyces sp. TS43310]|nr:MAG: hypothetical protein M1818_003430 [Claussenomyces sp. TS43310]
MKQTRWIRKPIEMLRQRYAGHPMVLMKTAFKGVFAVHLFFDYFFAYSLSYGASMLPTFAVYRDGMLISRWYRRGRGVQVGDVVAFDSVVEPGERVIKRVIGMEGDYVLRDTPGSGSQHMLQIPVGHCWVVGDNLPASRDSRIFGPLPMALIKGKIIAKITPWSERRWVTNNLHPFNQI